jgi:serine/threonine-protein kinase RsbW
LILSELATNAVIHSASSEPGGKFTITTEVRKGEYVRIETRDNGGAWTQRENCDGRPHGRDIVASLAAAHGVSGDPLAGWTAWAVIDWRGALAPREASTNG